jgi:hypothetical protein
MLAPESVKKPAVISTFRKVSFDIQRIVRYVLRVLGAAIDGRRRESIGLERESDHAGIPNYANKQYACLEFADSTRSHSRSRSPSIELWRNTGCEFGGEAGCGVEAGGDRGRRRHRRRSSGTEQVKTIFGIIVAVDHLSACFAICRLRRIASSARLSKCSAKRRSSTLYARQLCRKSIAFFCLTFFQNRLRTS